MASFAPQTVAAHHQHASTSPTHTITAPPPRTPTADNSKTDDGRWRKVRQTHRDSADTRPALFDLHPGNPPTNRRELLWLTPTTPST